MKLKQYQADTLAVLRRFFEEARVAGPRNAYKTITQAPEQASRLGRYAGTYTPLARLPEIPYVLPAPSHRRRQDPSRRSFSGNRPRRLGRERPSPGALAGTATTPSACRPSRRSRTPVIPTGRRWTKPSRDECGSSTSWDFTHLRPHDLLDHCCVLVGTIQALRVKNTEGRKVYAHNEDLEPHFAAVPETLTSLERLDGGGVKLSFANLLHVHRPLMIVDEAHNAVTGLTREMQARVNPCAIRRVHRHPSRHEGSSVQQHPAHRHGLGTEGGSDDQASDPALRARYLAGRRQRRHRYAGLTRDERKGRHELHPASRPVSGSAEEPGSNGRDPEGLPDGARGHPFRQNRRRDRRPTGA